MQTLTVKEVAALKGCSEQYIRKQISSGAIQAERLDGIYLLPVDTLPPDLKRKYSRRQRDGAASRTPFIEPAHRREWDELSADEREQVNHWTGIMEDWLLARRGFARQTDADELFVASLRLKGIDTNVKTLYRKLRAYRDGDMEGLIDKRGGWNRGQSAIPEDIWNYFLYAYLDDRCLPITQCYDLAKSWTMHFVPEMVSVMPSVQAFRRRIEKDIPKSVETLGRYGNKRYDDRCAPYITRLYDELHANDYWIADNHTLDIISRREDGTETTHRLSLTAFIDARSGVIVGWNLTDNPNSQSTILALRHAIQRFGIPWKCLFDNGSEFLTHDLAGRGHRTRKSASLTDAPPPIFKRLGIELTNAIVCNAKAKPIERTFNTLKGMLSRSFETFTGGNVLEKPESLKMTLKRGNVPLDSQMRQLIGDFIDGIYNVGLYGGAVTADRGKTRIEVWNESITDAGQRRASPEDLHLMLMRTSRPQKVGRKGVHITVCGEKLEYWDADILDLEDTQVYVRYDPDDLRTVRLYDAETDKFIRTLPMALSTTLLFDDTPENIGLAQEDIRRVKKAVRGKLEEYRSQLPPDRQIDILDMRIRQANAGKEIFDIRDSKLVIPVRANEEPFGQAVGAEHMGTVVNIDLAQMNRNIENRRK